jgi:hypothetical protein
MPKTISECILNSSQNRIIGTRNTVVPLYTETLADQLDRYVLEMSYLMITECMNDCPDKPSKNSHSTYSVLAYFS